MKKLPGMSCNLYETLILAFHMTLLIDICQLGLANLTPVTVKKHQV